MPNPFPHQVDAANFFLRTGRCLLCHAPGLGKTKTALWAAGKRGFRRLLVLHPAKVTKQWKENIHEIFPGAANTFNFSWDSQKAVEAIQQLQTGDIVIEDEIHYLKNADSARFKRVAPLLHQQLVTYGLPALGLSATPIYSYVSDCFSELYALGLVGWEQRSGFLLKFCKPKTTVRGLTFTDANERTLPQLRQQLQPYVHLVTWESSGIQMPPVTLEDYPADLDLPSSQLVEYQQAAAEFGGWYQTNRGHPAPPLARFVTLRVLLAQAKVATAFKRLADELRTANFKILLFSSFKEPLFQLQSLCSTAGLQAFIHTGDDSQKARENELGKYLEYPGSCVLLATIKSLGDAKDGLQHAGNRIFLLDLDYDPSSFIQLVGRLRRLGQQRPVSVLRFYLPKDQLEEHIVDNIGKKEKFIAQVGLLNEGMAFSRL